jgi:hypothetical protein
MNYRKKDADLPEFAKIERDEMRCVVRVSAKRVFAGRRLVLSAPGVK